MPFKSESQRRWMHANEPAIANKWEGKMLNGKKLPEKVAVIEKTAFWAGFNKQASGDGFTGTGKGVIQGGLESVEKDGPVHRSTPGGDSTLVTKELRDRVRGPREFKHGHMGDELQDESIPLLRY
jgi:hypothetical protein